MSSFTSALIMQKESDQQWKVVKSYSYEIGYLGSGELITVPEGFVSDLASIPRLLWACIPPDGNYTQSAVLHDWMVSNKGQVEKFYNYKQVSKIFLESMAVLKVPYVTRYCIYYAVLWFGPKF